MAQILVVLDDTRMTCMAQILAAQNDTRVAQILAAHNNDIRMAQILVVPMCCEQITPSLRKNHQRRHTLLITNHQLCAHQAGLGTLPAPSNPHGSRNLIHHILCLWHTLSYQPLAHFARLSSSEGFPRAIVCVDDHVTSLSPTNTQTCSRERNTR